MACNADLVQYIVEQCSGAGEITVKKMMGDYCIYCDGIIFGLICDNNLYIKPTYQGAANLKEVVMRSPYPGAKEHFLINDVDDRDYLTAIIKSTIPALPKPKAKKNPQPICPRLLCRQQGRLSGRCHQVLALEEEATGKPSV